MGKYKEIEYTQYEVNVLQTLQRIEAAIMTQLENLEKLEDSTFDERIACYQGLMQVRQTYLLQNISDQLRLWNMNGVPVYPMAK